MKKTLIHIFVFLLLTIPTGLVLAQSDGYILIEPTIIGEPADSQAPVEFLDYLKAMFTTFLVVTIFLAVLMWVVGGFQYIISYSKGQLEEGKARIWNATIGLIIALVSWLILNTINPDLVTLKGLMFP